MAIDKVILKIEDMKLSTLERRCDDAGKYKRKVRLSSEKGWALQIGPPNEGLYGKIGYNDLIYKIITRPSAYESYADYLEALLKVFKPEELECAPIIKTDYCVDYALPARLAFRGINVKYKRTFESYKTSEPICETADRSGRTGIYIGKGNDRFVIYDKVAQMMNRYPNDTAKITSMITKALDNVGCDPSNPKPPYTNDHLTRVESQHLGKNQYIENVFALPSSVDFLIQDIFPSVWSRITLCDVEVIEEDSTMVRVGHDKVSALKASLDAVGYFATKKTFGKCRNFSRDYGQYLKCTYITPQPKDYLVSSLKRFFKTP